MENIIAIFKNLIAWLKEFVDTVKKFAAGFDKDFPNMTDNAF